MLIATRDNTKTITDIREDAVGVLNEANQKGLLYVSYRSRPQAVLIDIDEFTRLMDMLEDYQDSLEAKRLEKIPKGEGVSLSEVKNLYE